MDRNSRNQRTGVIIALLSLAAFVGSSALFLNGRPWVWPNAAAVLILVVPAIIYPRKVGMGIWVFMIVSALKWLLDLSYASWYLPIPGWRDGVVLTFALAAGLACANYIRVRQVPGQ